MKRRLFLGAMGATSLAFGMGRARPKKPKYIFYMIGDGMGVNQRVIADRYARMKYPARKDGLIMNQLPVRSLTTTSEVAGKTTDSAAAGTALACGVKTINGAIGFSADLKTPQRTITSDAMDAGMKTGLVTSVPIDHATPASFYAQVPKRGMYYEIDVELANSGIDYLAGEPMLGRKKAKDLTPPQDLAAEAGYTLVGDRAGFDALKPENCPVLVEHDLGYAIDGPQTISLADYTRKGIEILDGDSGFFMMVEGGKIDWSGHANDLATNIHEMLAFDDAIAVAYAFCQAHPEDALMVITADHETGGLEITDKGDPKVLVEVIDAQEFQGAHYAEQVKRWKKGGTISAKTAYKRLTESFGLTDLSAERSQHILESVQFSMSQEPADTRNPEIQKMYGNKNAAVVSCLHEVAARAGTRWTTFGHTNVEVETNAFGRWSEPFGGVNDNTDLALILRGLITS
jgi:alkaline phosphatase